VKKLFRPLLLFAGLFTLLSMGLPTLHEPPVTSVHRDNTVTSSCTGLSWNTKVCTSEQMWFTRDTKIAEVNVSAGETVHFHLTPSAKITLTTGFKQGSNDWSNNGSISLTLDSTSVDYIFGGNCYVYGSAYNCNLTRHIYAKVQFYYERKDYYFKNQFVKSEYSVTPVRFVGSSAYHTYTTNSINGKPLEDVKNNLYGGYFVIFSERSTTKAYRAENTYHYAFDVPTPVGTYYGEATTQYMNSHSIKWSTSEPNKIFYH
jgi:hypothetical protein